jgi:hypothetical protein
VPGWYSSGSVASFVENSGSVLWMLRGSALL